MKNPINGHRVSPDNQEALGTRGASKLGSSKPEGEDGLYGLKSKWPEAKDLAGSNLPCRL